MQLAGRRILVTGSSSGIGAATAKLFLEEGARVALVDRATEGSEALAAQWSGRASVHVADLVAPQAAAAAVESAIRTMGGLDGLVNCAGVSLRKPLEETSDEEWRQVMAVNLDAPFYLCRAAVPAIRAAGGGTIVNVSSGAAFRPSFHFSAYCASKAGLMMFSKALAYDLAKENIRVNALCPGVIDTPMIERAITRSPDPAAAEARFLGMNAMARLGRPEELAMAILYLTSDASSFVTGSAHAVDGGGVFH